jgi:gliding motility-associated-like protein
MVKLLKFIFLQMVLLLLICILVTTPACQKPCRAKTAVNSLIIWQEYRTNLDFLSRPLPILRALCGLPRPRPLPLLTIVNFVLLPPDLRYPRMKTLLALSLLCFPLASFTQINCTVTPSDTLLCYRDSMAFVAAVTGTGTIIFRWQKNGQDIPGDNDTLAFSHALESDTGFYRCIVTNGSDVDTSNNAHLRMHPAMRFDTLYRYNALGCRADCKGQFKALVSGGTPPYDFSWGGGFSQDTIVFGLCMGNYRLKVYDSVGCMIDSAYYVDVLKSPHISFISYLHDYQHPQDTFYLSNPVVTVEFPPEYRDSIVNWEWDFGDEITVANINPATHTYAKTGDYTILLTVTDLNSCDTTVAHDIAVKIAQLKIPYAFTPNGDGKNDQFKIQIEGNADVDFRDAYLGNELLVFDRWGKKVFSSTNYKSGDWDGGNCSDGVYYYILRCRGYYDEEVFRGSITILGKGF